MRENKENIIAYEYDPSNQQPLDSDQKRELTQFTNMPDSGIDYSDIPPLVNFEGFRRLKDLPDLVRVDKDILAWVKSMGKDPEATINHLLRKEMQAALRTESDV